MQNEIVYSSDKGDLRKPEKKTLKKAATPSGIKLDGTVRVRLESKGRGGKTVTAVYGLPLQKQDLELLASQIKQKCGTGGTVQDGLVIIQGDRVVQVMGILVKEGYTVKRSGG